MANLTQLEEFGESVVWREMKDTFLMRLSAVRDDLEDPNGTREDDLRNKGRAEELRFASELLTLMIEDAKEDKCQEEDRKELEKGGMNHAS